MNGSTFEIPETRQGASGPLALGIRPEHVHLDPEAGYRAKVTATEYLGTTQIVTLATKHGEVKARISSTQKVAEGSTTGLRFDPRKITLFDAKTTRALRSAGNEEVLHNG